MKKIKLIILLLLFLVNLCIFTGCKKNKNEYTINDLENAINNLNDNLNSSYGNYTFKFMQECSPKDFNVELFGCFFCDKGKGLGLNCDGDLYLQQVGNIVIIYEEIIDDDLADIYDKEYVDIIEYWENSNDFDKLFNTNSWEYYDKLDNFAKNFCNLLKTSKWENYDKMIGSIYRCSNYLGIPLDSVSFLISLVQSHKEYFTFKNGVFVGNVEKITEYFQEKLGDDYDNDNVFSLFNIKLHKNDSNGIDLAIMASVPHNEYEIMTIYEFSNIGTTTIDGLFSK